MISLSASYRTYAANKMYHMGTPLYTLTCTKDEYETLITEYKASQDVLDQMQKGGKKNIAAKRNAENNVKVAERLEEDLPKIEEAEAVCLHSSCKVCILISAGCRKSSGRKSDIKKHRCESCALWRNSRRLLSL
jgi:hypothetical protein